jgi:nitrous oxidase accessory protein NosD
MDGWLGVLYKGNDGLTVSQNRMAINKNGVVVQPNPATDVTVSGNTIALGTAPAGDATAMYMTGVNGAVVSGNTATGYTGGRAIAGSNLTDFDLTGNIFTGNNDGISFWGATTFITIAGNDLSGNLRYGINIKGQDIEITGNDINGCGDSGVNVDRHVIDTERVSVGGNDLSGNLNYGLKVNTANVTAVVDASANWWGSADPAAVSSSANNGDGADYTPWLNSGTNLGPGPGFDGDFATLNVDDDSPQTGTVTRVQEGVNLVTGSIVNLAPGDYEEQVVIDKTLDLIGSGLLTPRTKSAPCKS